MFEGVVVVDESGKEVVGFRRSEPRPSRRRPLSQRNSGKSLSFEKPMAAITTTPCNPTPLDQQ